MQLKKRKSAKPSKATPAAKSDAVESAPVAGGQTPACDGHDHRSQPISIDLEACERAAAIFRALGDPQRLRLLVMLEASERCVSEMCEMLDETMPAISQRLRLLKSERIVRSRRDGKHIYYSLADEHISRLVTNGVMHAMEISVPVTPKKKES